MTTKRKTLHRPLARSNLPREPITPRFILALKRGPETLGYFVSDDAAVVKRFEDAFVYTQQDLAEDIARTQSSLWELPPGESFVVIAI